MFCIANSEYVDPYSPPLMYASHESCVTSNFHIFLLGLWREKATEIMKFLHDYYTVDQSYLFNISMVEVNFYFWPVRPLWFLKIFNK